MSENSPSKKNRPKPEPSIESRLKAQIKPSKDPYELGFNKGLEDNKSGRKRHRHGLGLFKLITMRTKDLNLYMDGYDQGYSLSVKSKRLNMSWEFNSDDRYKQRLERNKSKSHPEHDGPEPSL